MWIEVPPFLLFFLGAVVVALAPRGWIRSFILLALPVLGGLNLLGAEAGSRVQLELLDYTLTPFRVDRLSLLFGYVFHIAAFIGNLFALHLRKENDDTLQHASALLYAGSALGAVFAGDWITLFVFWELLTLTSTFLIWARGSKRSVAAGIRYLVIQVVSGVLLLAGVLVLTFRTGEITFSYVGLDGAGGWLLFLAFGIKAAFPLLHNWLTDAYPEGTATGTVFLSVFSTKVAVYALARVFPGTEILIYIGATMTVFPIFYAVIENDLRRVLAYSLNNQLGFMVVGIGIGTELALNGTAAHAFCHILYKALLFMGMGAVLHQTGRINGSDLGGLYKTMPITAALTTVGAASISAFPLFSGFVSKSMIMSALLYEGYLGVWPVLLFASAGVFHHSGIKIPYFAFFAHDSGIRTKEPPLNMLLAMGLAAALSVGIGVFPQALYAILPFDVDYWPYDPTHVLSQTQLLFFGALAFVGLQKTGIYPAELRSVNLDVEWTYRSFAPKVVRAVARRIGTLNRRVRRAFLLTGVMVGLGGSKIYGPGGLARQWPTGNMVIWVTVMLATYLLLYFF